MDPRHRGRDDEAMPEAPRGQETMISRRWKSIAWVGGVLAVASSVAYEKGGLASVGAAVAGCAIAIVAAVLHHVLIIRGERASEAAQSQVAVNWTVAASMTAFGILLSTIFSVHRLWPDVAPAFAYTALCTYLGIRFIEAFTSRRPPCPDSGTPSADGESSDEVNHPPTGSAFWRLERIR